MVEKKLVIALACVACASMISVATIHVKVRRGNGKNPPRKPEVRAIQNPALIQSRMLAQRQMEAQLELDPDFAVQFDDEILSTPAEVELYQNLASALNGFTEVPMSRTAYFSGVTEYYLSYWSGMISNVSPIPGGYRVTTRVTPIFSPTLGGGTLVIPFSDYSEVFDVIDGVVTYVNSLDPLGLSGEPLATIHL